MKNTIESWKKYVRAERIEQGVTDSRNAVYSVRSFFILFRENGMKADCPQYIKGR